MAAAESDLNVPLSDECLVEKVVAGDEEAFAILYNRYFSRVYHFVNRRLRNRADTEETVQEVFINVFSSLGSYRGEAPFAAWVLGVSRRVVASRFKKKRLPIVPLDAEEELEPSDTAGPGLRREPSPLENYECQERFALIRAAAERHLSPEQWELFVLHHLRSQSIQDIARARNKSEDAVKSNLYRARKVLLAR